MEEDFLRTVGRILPTGDYQVAHYITMPSRIVHGGEGDFFTNPNEYKGLWLRTHNPNTHYYRSWMSPCSPPSRKCKDTKEGAIFVFRKRRISLLLPNHLI